ncbi:DUF6086 family protein [Amycolatopsis vancoresmycina]|uniref:Uncharacterized protein n=1 Tax=Amycolatopsis vancoresmycina DSM 44592 TaxID=1292037 RepID=R1FUW9_9PSEU|nr:DUF6086 family protein [Amycolatopsis vancoresmycina]EOD63213.1 hypothetical protein H480_38230 [Amycolatopsis vancoresmycina DSM 44592]
MSQYFSIDGTDVWNPSNGPGTLFVHLAAAHVPLGGPHGIGTTPGDPDDHPIDGTVFAAFADALVAEYRATSHPIKRALLEGFVATAAVMARRGGLALPALDGPAGHSPRDVPGGGAAGPDRLAELVAEYERAMPV